VPDPIHSETAQVETTAVRVDLVNVSPFRQHKQQSDPVRHWTFIGLGIVLLVFLGSMVAVLMMHAPTL
jgi:hypothetical protein